MTIYTMTKFKLKKYIQHAGIFWLTIATMSILIPTIIFFYVGTSGTSSFSFENIEILLFFFIAMVSSSLSIQYLPLFFQYNLSRKSQFISSVLSALLGSALFCLAYFITVSLTSLLSNISIKSDLINFYSNYYSNHLANQVLIFLLFLSISYALSIFVIVFRTILLLLSKLQKIICIVAIIVISQLVSFTSTDSPASFSLTLVEVIKHLIGYTQNGQSASLNPLNPVVYLSIFSLILIGCYYFLMNKVEIRHLIKN